MQTDTAVATNVREVVPFLRVSDMRASLRFYGDALGFTSAQQWVVDGEIRWCKLVIGGASIMLQQFPTSGEDSWQSEGRVGEGVSLEFMCDDAIAIYRQAVAAGIAEREPQVGNGLWVTSLRDPDGYHIEFESPTDAPEEITLSEFEGQSGSRA